MCNMVHLRERNELSYPEDVIGKHFAPMLNPQAYCRRAVFVPFVDHLVFVSFVDHLLSDLSTRFTQLNKKSIQGLLLLPPNLTSLTEEKVVELHEHFNED
jgi:hypothetical protein